MRTNKIGLHVWWLTVHKSMFMVCFWLFCVNFFFMFFAEDICYQDRQASRDTRKGDFDQNGTTGNGNFQRSWSCFLFFICVHQLMMKTLGPSSLIGGRLSMTMFSTKPYLSSLLFPAWFPSVGPLGGASWESPSFSTGWDSWLVSSFIVILRR